MNEDSFIRLSAADNVFVLPGGGKSGGIVGNVALRGDIPPCHKAASEDIASGDPVIKYGKVIGTAARDIARGDWVHDHNVYSMRNMGNAEPFPWKGPYPHDAGRASASFMGYRRAGVSRPGIRNELWVIPANIYIRGEIRYILSHYRKPFWIDAVRLIDIPFSLAERGVEAGETEAGYIEDMALGLAASPNAAGVLFVGLGCGETPASNVCDKVTADRVMYVSLTRDGEDSVPEHLDCLAAEAPRFRECFPISCLCAGIAGARGRFSGFTANPVLGRLSDRLASQGAVTLAAGTPELFASDRAISERITSREIYDAFVSMSAVSVWNMPMLDSWENGVTTTEEHAMSFMPVIGESPVTGFLRCGEMAGEEAGLRITHGSGDCAVNCTIFVASGAQIVLMAASGGTPFGSVVPTVKISADSPLVSEHPGWIDFDAGPVLRGEPIDSAAARLEEYILRVACGERVAHERKGFGDAAF